MRLTAEISAWNRLNLFDLPTKVSAIAQCRNDCRENHSKCLPKYSRGQPVYFAFQICQSKLQIVG